MVEKNTLYYGDNLDILRRYIKDETIDLIYLDPPFNSKATYNVLFAEKNGSQSAAQIKAFDDTWHWDTAAAEAYYEVVEGGGPAADAMRAFRLLLGDNDMLAYLSMMAPRLIELHRVLKPTGSVYLHCDPTASHYLKVLMDAVFSPRNFLNELIWYYRGAGVPKKARARRHDVLFVYTKEKNKHYFNADPIRQPYAQATTERFSHYIGNVRGGRDYGVQKLNPLGKHPDDVMTHIQPIAPSAKARLGYPTQKPEELLEHVVLAGSQEGHIVLDPFCGCGTTIAVAQRLGRSWIGIDITHLAITLSQHRLHDAYGDQVTYEVVGEPITLSGAKELAQDDRFQFEMWALGLVGARPTAKKKGADKGIDGRLYFHDDPKGKTKQIVISVKSGHVSVSQVRDLRGVVDREKAEIGAFITLQESTGPMRREAASAGFYVSRWGRHPRMQILTVEELLEGKGIDYPSIRGANVTFEKAPKAQGDTGYRQASLEDDAGLGHL